MPQLTLPFSAIPVSAYSWKQQALAWAQQQHQVVAYYDSNQFSYLHGPFQNLLGVRNTASGNVQSGVAQTWSEIEIVQKNFPEQPLLGFLTYDLKNSLEQLESRHPDFMGFPEIYFFIPDIWLQWEKNSVTINTIYESPIAVAEAISAMQFSASLSKNSPKTVARFTESEYLETVQKLKDHILEGDVYEVNLCQEFYAENYPLDPLSTFWKLMEVSPTPFAGFLKLSDKYLLCASPERFLKKENNLLVSQPIKGTIRRGQTPEQDLANKAILATSEKERAENMMIVDLVRNDLSRVATTGSVSVEEMFGLYGFEYVWQMISTVTARLDPNYSSVQALQAAFPMGSMTGAPKVKALELIERYEKTKRGLYSGSLGYFLPNGDFDFNVVIRSIQYNSAINYLSYEVGSAITYDSEPEQEFAECHLKAEAIVKILG